MNLCANAFSSFSLDPDSAVSIIAMSMVVVHAPRLLSFVVAAVRHDDTDGFISFENGAQVADDGVWGDTGSEASTIMGRSADAAS